LIALIFIPALSHTATTSFYARWKQDSVEESKTKSFVMTKIDLAVSNHGTLIGLAALVDPIHENYEGDKTHPCPRPTPTRNGFDCLPLT